MLADGYGDDDDGLTNHYYADRMHCRVDSGFLHRRTVWSTDDVNGRWCYYDYRVDSPGSIDHHRAVDRGTNRHRHCM